MRRGVSIHFRYGELGRYDKVKYDVEHNKHQADVLRELYPQILHARALVMGGEAAGEATTGGLGRPGAADDEPPSESVAAG